jgi:MFS family permease
MGFRLERRAWTLIYLCLGIVEGGTAAVMVRSLFGEQVHGIVVDLVLAIVSAAPAWANLASLAFARRAQGRPKIRFLLPLLVTMSVSVGALALVPRGGLGLVAFLVFYAISRLAWAGVETVRSVLWSVNYPRRLRARITGLIMVSSAIALAAAGLSLGWLLQHGQSWFRIAIVVCAGCGLAGTVLFRQVRIRREQELLEAERARLDAGTTFDLAGIRALLQKDAAFRRYMYVMSLFGAGNLMFTPILVVCLDEVMKLPELWQIAITTALPVLVIPLAIQPWAHYLDRHRVIVFRSIHGWVYLAAVSLLALGILAGWPVLLWPGALLMGVSMAAGSLGWTLGHNDFAPRGEETRYMALHVTLSGLRGLLAPPVGIALYYVLEWLHEGLGPWAMLLPMALAAMAAVEFTAMRRSRIAPVRET